MFELVRKEYLSAFEIMYVKERYTCMNLDWSILISGDDCNYVVPGGEYVRATEQFGEDFSGAEFHETRTLLADGGDRFGVSTATFDTIEELMWMGNQGVCYWYYLYQIFYSLLY